MTGSEYVFDIAILLVLTASLSAGLASGLPLRRFTSKKNAGENFRISLFFVFLSICAACSAASFILISRLSGIFPDFAGYCASGFIAGILSALFPRSAGISLISVSAALVFISFTITAQLTPLEPGAPAGWLFVQDAKPGMASVVFEDSSGSKEKKLAGNSLEIEAQTLLVRGPLGALTGRRHYRFITFREVAPKNPLDKAMSRFLLSLAGLTLGTSRTDRLQLRYLSGYVLRFDSGMNLSASLR